MSTLEVLAVLAAGIAAGTINVVVGSGTLITFPTLLAIGLPPITANVSNGIGLVPGSIAGAIGYRRELRGQGRRAARLAIGSATGAVAGAVLLLVLPEDAFRAIVPVFIVAALVLVVRPPKIVPSGRAPALAFAGVLVAGVYGGFFGAAQGILLLAVLGMALPDDLQRLNALKNVLAAVANGVSGLVFALVAEVDWLAVGLIAAGATLGGTLGGRYGRRLPAKALRAIIVVVGVVAIVQLVRGA